MRVFVICTETMGPPIAWTDDEEAAECFRLQQPSNHAKIFVVNHRKLKKIFQYPTEYELCQVEEGFFVQQKYYNIYMEEHQLCNSQYRMVRDYLYNLMMDDRLSKKDRKHVQETIHIINAIAEEPMESINQKLLDEYSGNRERFLEVLRGRD